MFMYNFSVSETQHAALIGETSRRTRMLRRALIHKLTGQNYAEMPAQTLLEMSTTELMTLLKVVDQEGCLLVHNQQPIPLHREAQLRRINHMYEGGYGPGSRSQKFKHRGAPLSSDIYGYQRTSSGKYTPDLHQAFYLKRGFEIAAQDGYTEAGRYLNRVHIPTPTGLSWSKDTTRDFFRNTIYAGYIKEFLQDKKRGPIALYPAWKVVPLITLAEWIAANHRYAHSQQIKFPTGFINAADQEIWLHLISHVSKCMRSEGDKS